MLKAREFKLNPLAQYSYASCSKFSDKLKESVFSRNAINITVLNSIG